MWNNKRNSLKKIDFYLTKYSLNQLKKITDRLIKVEQFYVFWLSKKLG